VSNLTVGIAGTAKNTGKTTTMSCLISEIRKSTGLTIGLTSIGYDGESFDNVTGLPKPRIDVEPGDIAAIAETCVRDGCAVLQEVKRTGISTALGEVVIYRVTAPGKVILAGANNRRDLSTVLQLLRDFTTIVIIDGALNRIVPMVEADCLIIATGAARTTDITLLAHESNCIVEILSIPEIAEVGNVITSESILSEVGFKSLMEKSIGADTIRINGVIGLQYLEELAGFFKKVLYGKRLIFDDPIKLLIAGDAIRVHKVLCELNGVNSVLGVAEKNKLLALTVNPYYPKYRYESADYQAAYVNSDELLQKISGSIEIPCFDLIKQGSQGLFSILKQEVPGM